MDLNDACEAYGPYSRDVISLCVPSRASSALPIRELSGALPGVDEAMFATKKIRTERKKCVRSKA